MRALYIARNIPVKQLPYAEKGNLSLSWFCPCFLLLRAMSDATLTLNLTQHHDVGVEHSL